MATEDKEQRRGGEEFMKFLVVGGVSFLLHNIVYLLLIRIDINASIAYALGYATWMVTNFTLSNLFVFRTRPTLKRAVGFCISSAVYFAIQFAGFTLCRHLNIPDALITPIVYTIAFPINFLMVRYVLKK